MKGRILQIAELFLQKEGEEEAHHILTWEAFKKICNELEITTDYKERVFLERRNFPIEGKPIKEWPEQEPVIGNKRLFFCVPQHADFGRIAAFKKPGIDVIIQAYGLLWPPNDPQVYLDKAKKYGLKVMFSLKPHIHDRLREGQPWERNKCRDTVLRYKSHPAYYLSFPFDELDAGIDYSSAGVSKELQREIVGCIHEWSGKGVATSVRGGVKGWHLLDFEIYELVISNTYAFNGTGLIWDKKPLNYLLFVAKQERTYIDENRIKTPIIFMGQCDSHPATEKGLEGTKMPLGQIENQINIFKEYGLLTPGTAFYAWNGGDFDPMRNDEIYEEMKTVFDKITLKPNIKKEKKK